MFCSKIGTISSRAKARRVSLSAILLVSSGCVRSVDVAETTTPAEQEDAIALVLKTPDERFVELSDLRGNPTLLFVFATFDGVSQAALRPLSRFVRAHEGELNVVGVAAQPNAKDLIDAWQAALHPPFVVCYDPTKQVEEGTSALGRIETVPSYVMLSAWGVETARASGFQSENALQRLWQKSGGPDSNAEPTARPLLGDE